MMVGKIVFVFIIGVVIYPLFHLNRLAHLYIYVDFFKSTLSSYSL